MDKHAELEYFASAGSASCDLPAPELIVEEVLHERRVYNLERIHKSEDIP